MPRPVRSPAAGRRAGEQTCKTAAALSSVSLNDGSTSCARCSKSLIASNPASTDAAGAISARGSDSGGTGQLRSPSTPRTSRLVVRMDRAGQIPSSRSARSATAAARCSQLSRTISIEPSPRCPAIVSVTSCPGLSSTPSWRATARATMAGSSIGASSTQHTPPAKDAPAASAAASASRVFPVPPGPVRVSNRLRDRESTTSWISHWRPTSGASRTGSGSVFSDVMCPALRLASPSPRHARQVTWARETVQLKTTAPPRQIILPGHGQAAGRRVNTDPRADQGLSGMPAAAQLAWARTVMEAWTGSLIHRNTPDSRLHRAGAMRWCAPGSRDRPYGRLQASSMPRSRARARWRLGPMVPIGTPSMRLAWS